MDVAEAAAVSELRPYAMVAGGDAIARAPDGRVVFVTGALPDELVRVEVTGRAQDYLRAHAVEVIEASPARVDASCPEFGRGCGGCQWQHIAVADQRTFKRKVIEDVLRRTARLEAPTIEPVVELPATGYRTTLRAGVVQGRAGYRQRRQHHIVAVGSCEVAHPLVEDLLLHGDYGDADEVVLRCGARTGERMAMTDPPGARMTIPDDARRAHVHEVVAGRTWRISGPSFFQSRPDGADALAALVAAAAADVRPGGAVDLYSGVGLFAGVLADRGWSVTAVESSKVAVGDARANLRKADVDVVRADVLKWRPPAADLVIANPSRQGLGKRGVATAVATGARRVVLVSCDVGAFGRDAGLLHAAGYRLASVTPVDLFPHTFHVEVVSVIDRA